MVDFPKILEVLEDARVNYVLIGGGAMIAHGSAYVTRDVDICYDRTRENLKRLAEGLRPFHPRLRGAPPELPFLWDEETLRRGMNFTLATDLGDIDLLGEVSGLGSYTDALASSQPLQAYGRQCQVLTLEALIRTKKATGRGKDLAGVVELEALLNLRKEGP
ncbi:MAG: hypothetical protein ACRD5G_16215 [Candidatus Acidiferrales bacterium]